MLALVLTLAAVSDPRLDLAAELLGQGQYALAEDLALAAYLEREPRAAIVVGLAREAQGDYRGALACFEEVGAVSLEARTRYVLGLPSVDWFRFAVVPGESTTIYNLGAAMHAEDMKARRELSLALAQGCETEWFVPHALRLLSEYEPPRMARRIREQADYLEERWELAHR